MKSLAAQTSFQMLRTLGLVLSDDIGVLIMELVALESSVPGYIIWSMCSEGALNFTSIQQAIDSWVADTVSDEESDQQCEDHPNIHEASGQWKS